MSMSEIVFEEDTTDLKPLPPEIEVPTTGFEGWFYRKFPGGYYLKKTILIGIIFALFFASLAFFALGRYNFKMEEVKSFDELTNETDL